MTPDTADTRAILERLERLEKQNRRLKRSGLAALILVSAVLLMGQATHRSRVVAAERFNLLDSTGKTRAELLMLGDGPALKLYDAQRKVRAALSIYQSTPFLGLYDPSGMARIGLTNTAEEGPSLWLADATGRPRAQLDAIGGHPRLYLQDKKGLAASVGDDTLQNPQTGRTENTSAASVLLFGSGRKIIWRAP
jgi:hypothetical protein